MLGALLVVAVCAAALWWFFLRPATAEDAALAVFRALGSGDAAQVDASGVVVPDTARAAFHSALGFVADPEVRSSQEQDGYTRVTVAFHLDGDPYEATIRVHKREDRWIPVAEDVLAAVTPAVTPGTGIGIGGSFYANGEAVTLLPGVYPLAPAPVRVLQGEQRVRVFPGEVSALSVQASLRPDAAEIAQGQLNVYLDACTVPATTVPEHCGIRIPWGADLASLSEVRFRIESYPVIELGGGGFVASRGELVATAIGKNHAGKAHTVTYRTTDWTVRGDLDLTTEGFVLRAW